jgi:hypothetical protein
MIGGVRYTQSLKMNLLITTERFSPSCSFSVVYKLDQVVARSNISRECCKRRFSETEESWYSRLVAFAGPFLLYKIAYMSEGLCSRIYPSECEAGQSAQSLVSSLKLSPDTPIVTPIGSDVEVAPPLDFCLLFRSASSIRLRNDASCFDDQAAPSKSLLLIGNPPPLRV